MAYIMFHFGNINYFERFVRIVIGLVWLSTYFFLPHPLALLGLFGLVPLITGIIGWCPVHALVEKYRNNGS